MNESITKLNKCEADLNSWKSAGIPCVQAFSPCKIGIQVSVKAVTNLCDWVYRYERQLDRFEFLQLVLKDENREDWSMMQALKKISFPGQSYWSEIVGAETTIFGVSKEGVKMFALFYDCNEDKDYVKEYIACIQETEKERDFDDLMEVSHVINDWLMKKEIISGIKSLKRMSRLPGTLRNSCFIIWGPEMASLFNIETSSIYVMLSRFNTVTVTGILDAKFGNAARDCLAAGLIDKAALDIIS